MLGALPVVGVVFKATGSVLLWVAAQPAGVVDSLVKAFLGSF